MASPNPCAVSIVGLTPPRSGRVTLFGKDVTGQPPYRIAAAGVGFVPEGRKVFANLTVDENLKVPLERPGPYTIDRVYKLFPRLAERKQNLGRQLSGGEQEMLSIGRALLLNPRLLILDEPFNALDVRAVEMLSELILEHIASGGMAIMTSHQEIPMPNGKVVQL